MKKTYISTTGTELTFPVTIAGRVKFISLNGPKNELSTTDELVQLAIETSKRFKKGEITISKGELFAEPVVNVPPVDAVNVSPKAPVIEPPVTETDPPANDVVKPTAPEAPATTEAPAAPAVTSEHVYPEVKTMQEAANVLMTKYGVKHQATRHPKAIENKAKEYGVSFPNLVL